jgi:ASC-1-like (ASCH) protein
LPLFFTKKEIFEWLKTGTKTIEIRKGNPRQGKIAVFQAGPKILRLKITRIETGSLPEVMRPDNFRSVIPSAILLCDAVTYMHKIYGVCNGRFTAYYLDLQRG